MSEQYTKARRRRFTKYLRNLETLLARVEEPTSVKASRQTWEFMRRAEGWAEWLKSPVDALPRDVLVVIDNTLQPGHFRVEGK